MTAEISTCACGIIGKAILTTIGEEIQEAAGALQVCAGHQAGSEAAIHAMRETFEDPCTEACSSVSGCLKRIQHSESKSGLT